MTTGGFQEWGTSGVFFLCLSGGDGFIAYTITLVDPFGGKMSADALLESVITLAETGIGFDVTLIAGGQVVQGEVIPLSTYFELVGQRFQDVGNDAGRGVGEVFKERSLRAKTAEADREELRERAFSGDEEANEELDGPEHIRSSIHLKDAAIVHNSAQGPSFLNVKVMRIALDAVSGWSYGSASRDS